MVRENLAEQMINESFPHISDLINRELSGNNFIHSTAERLNKKKIGEYSNETYEDYFKNNRIRAHSYNTTISDKKLNILSKALCYIPMSKKRKKEHDITYVVDNTDVDLDCNIMINDSDIHEINSNKSTINCVISFWENRARQLAGQSVQSGGCNLPNDDFSLSRFILRGKPGVGKTAFLNYAFSTHAESLNKNNIIWIRTDLSKPRGRDLGLRTQMYSKFLRIFCDFYLNNDSFPFDDNFIKIFKAELTSQAKKLKLLDYTDKDPSQLSSDYVGLLGNIHDILKERDSKPPNKKGRPPEVTSFYSEFSLTTQIANKFTEILMAHIQNKFKFGFILIFDGLDSVSMDYVQINIFQEWVGQLDGTTDNSSNKFNAVYITTMRDYSYIYFYKESKSHKIQNSFKEFSITPKNISHILTSRSKYASYLFAKQGLTIPANVITNVFHNIVLLLYLTTNFGEKSENDPLLSQRHFHHFHNMNNDNLRAAFRFLREFIHLLQDISSDDIYGNLTRKHLPEDLIRQVKSKEWEIIRLLLFGDSAIRLYKNKIQFGDLTIATDTDLSKPGLIKIDNHNRAVIPNIFNYRELVSESTQLKLKNLFKLRVIQFLDHQIGDRAGIIEIIDWYKKLFLYKGNDLRFEIREMIYNGIISPDGDQLSITHSELHELNYIVVLSELGKSLLKSVIHKSIYYEIICDDTPIQRDFAHYMIPINKMDKNVTLDTYIITKSRMVILFLYYLQKVENAEKNCYESVENDYNKYYLIFTNEVVSAIKTDLTKSIAGYLKSQKSKGLAWQKNFIAQWEDEFDMVLFAEDNQ